MSIIDSQDKYTFIMQHFEEYRRQCANHSGKDWVLANVLPAWVGKYGMDDVVDKEDEDEDEAKAEEEKKYARLGKV